MPGAFHVEVVGAGPQKVKAYLLDINWKNPSLSKSSLVMTSGKAQAKCIEAQNHYDCEFPKSINLNAPGKISVKATREGQAGAEVHYSLPLKLENQH